jgi:hypothetical protein
MPKLEGSLNVYRNLCVLPDIDYRILSDGRTAVSATTQELPIRVDFGALRSYGKTEDGTNLATCTCVN